MAKVDFKIWRGNSEGGEYQDFSTDVTEGMVVLDSVHQIQAESANDLACRWNCKAGKWAPATHVYDAHGRSVEGNA